MKTIIVAVDFSCITPVLIDKAEEMARCYKARVYIIHVASPDPEFVGYKVGPVHERQSRVSELRNEKKELEKIAGRFRNSGIEAIPLLIQGATADLILEQMERMKADLLIMGTHGHGFAMSVFLGSTSHQVIKRAACPVLLVPYKISAIEAAPD